MTMPATETVLTGNQGAVYWSAVGTPRATWAANASNGVYVATAPTGLNLLGIVRDVDWAGGGAVANVSSRLSYFELSKLATFKAEVTFKIPWAPDDLGLQALLQAWLTRALIPLAILDNLITASTPAQGLWMDAAVIDFQKTEPYVSEQMATIKVAPTSSAIPPQWVLTAAYADAGAI
jgi:hypothetical protein